MDTRTTTGMITLIHIETSSTSISAKEIQAIIRTNIKKGADNQCGTKTESRDMTGLNYGDH